MMRTGLLAGAAMIVMAAAAQAQAQVPPAPAPSLQQAFDAAEALDAGTDAAAALAAWQALEARTRPGSRSHAIVLLRTSHALVRLGRLDEAEPRLRQGIADLPADPSLRNDRMQALILSGAIARAALDYNGAITALEQALPLADTPADQLPILNGLAFVQIFTDTAAAATSLARADALARTMKLDADAQALLLRRRTLLNLATGDLPAAQASAVASVKALGGLTEQTRVNDIAVRSDAAIAYLLAGNKDEARRYMAMTGAGRLPEGSFRLPPQVEAPDCGGEFGLKPSDMAVVEFSLMDDGTVRNVSPVYAAGGGAVALEFARAVRRWTWTAADAQAIKPFYRQGVRIEMRCSTAFSRPSVGKSLDAQFEHWLREKNVDLAAKPETIDKATDAALRGELARASAADPNSLATLAALYRLVSGGTASREELGKLYVRARAIAIAQRAPAPALLALDVPARTYSVSNSWQPSVYARVIRPMLAEAPYVGDPSARAALGLILADRGNLKDAEQLTLLRAIAADKALDADDASRVGAAIRIAAIEQRAGRIDAARAAFAGTGLKADQCAILDAPPKAVSTPGADIFPDEALRWGFGGFTRLNFDVGADGRTINNRVVLSYPPFIFSEAGQSFTTKTRFSSTFRPDGGLGCGGISRNIVFLMPS